jgi:hypothetical protein
MVYHFSQLVNKAHFKSVNKKKSEEKFGVDEYG